MRVFHYEGRLRTDDRDAVWDVTDEVAEAVRNSGVCRGVACLYSPHTTSRLEVVDRALVHSPPLLACARLAGGMLPVLDGELAVGASSRIRFVQLDSRRAERWLLEVVGD